MLAFLCSLPSAPTALALSRRPQVSVQVLAKPVTCTGRVCRCGRHHNPRARAAPRRPALHRRRRRDTQPPVPAASHLISALNGGWCRSWPAAAAGSQAAQGLATVGQRQLQRSRLVWVGRSLPRPAGPAWPSGQPRALRPAENNAAALPANASSTLARRIGPVVMRQARPLTRAALTVP